ILPLMAQQGGELARAGRSRAARDLARMAGLCQPGESCESMHEDGSMPRLPGPDELAKQHGPKSGTTAGLIHYRTLDGPAVQRVSEQPLDTELGTFNLVTYRDSLENAVHLALTLGTIEPEEPTLVRVHNMDPLRDLFMVRQPGRWS